MRSDLLLDQFHTLVRTPEDVAELEASILDLAVRGQLVPPDPDDEPAAELLKQVRAERKRLVQEKKISRSKRLPAIRDEDIPYPVPENWLWCRLPEIYRDWGQGKPEDDFTYIDVSSIDNKRGVIGNDLAVLPSDEAPSRARKQVRQGTVIYSTVRPYLLNVAIVNRNYDPPPIVSTAFEVMHPLGGVFNKYLYYYLRSQPFTAFVESQMTGMAYPAISKSKLSRGLFPLPPLAEQKRIVARVDELLAQTRALAAQLKAADEALVPAAQASFQALTDAPDRAAQSEAWQRISDAFDALTADPRTLDALKQTVLQLAVQGKLVPQDPDDEPASVLLGRIKAEKEQLVKEGKVKKSKRLPALKATEIPYTAPGGWQWARFRDVASIATNLTKPSLHPDLPHIAPNNIEKGSGRLLPYNTVQEDGVRSSKHHFFPGQLLYSKIRPNLSKAIVVDFEGLCSADMYPVDAFVDPLYLLLYILSQVFLDMVVGKDTRVAMPKINQAELNRILIAVPPLAEQKRIVAKVESLLALCDKLTAEVVAAEEVRGRLLAAVLNGE